MTGKLSYADIVDMYTLGGYNVSAELSNSSALLAIVGLTYLQSQSVWLDYGDGFDIQDDLSLAIYEVMTNMAGGDYVKLDQVVYTSDIAIPVLTGFDPTGYRALKLIISGMLSNNSSFYVDHVMLEINNITASNMYKSFSQTSFEGTNVGYEYISTANGIVLVNTAVSNAASTPYFGNAEITFYNPASDNIKHIQYQSMAGGGVTEHPLYNFGMGTLNNTNDVTRVEIYPNDGTIFRVDPSDSNEPDELRMTIYGLK